MVKPNSSNNRLNGEKLFQIISAIVIPLVIAVATIFITIQQNELNKANRENDIDLAQKQREQDLFLSNKTREQDRDLSSRQRQQEQTIADQLRQDTLLDDYIREISQLLLSFNFTLTRIVREYIIRPQTLTVLRQLDANRKAAIVLFLFHSGLLSRGNDPISLEGANLDGINLDVEQDWRFRSYLLHLALPGTSLVNASFRNRELRFADFRFTQMNNASFAGASLLSAEFVSANLHNTKFSEAYLRFVDFSFANLTDCDLSNKQINEEILTLADAILPDGKTLGRAPNIIVNGDAELGSTYGWQLTSRTNITAIRNTNKTNETYGEWSFEVRGNGTQLTMWQRIDVIKYSNMIRQGGVHFVLSLEATPESAKVRISVKVLDSIDYELRNEIQVLSKFEINGDYIKALGFLPCDREARSIEITVKVIGATKIDNIHGSIEHAGHTVN
ncbi:hypothetical protein I4U23_001486 [Adineta vaga]|nr:hypothetical protein I4U23_001486 [Adineta vaga]